MIALTLQYNIHSMNSNFYLILKSAHNRSMDNDLSGVLHTICYNTTHVSTGTQR